MKHQSNRQGEPNSEDYRGSGYISQPSNTAPAESATQSIAPNRNCCIGSSCITRANTRDTKPANSVISQK